MATSSRASASIALGVLIACLLAGAANGKTFVVKWTANATAKTVPRLKVACGDSVVFSVAAKTVHSVVRVNASSSETNFTKVCSAKVLQVQFAAKNVTKATNYTIKYTTTGTRYYIDSVGKNCATGKIAIAVVVTGTCPKPPPKASPPPKPVASPPPKPVASPPPAGKTITQMWGFGIGPVTIQANCGDSVVFSSPGGPHDVVEVSTINSCAGASDATKQLNTVQAFTSNAFTTAPVMLSTAGQRTFLCTVAGGGHCQAGMLVTYNVVC